MRKIELKIYSFSELSEEAQQKAINKLSNINVDCQWWDSIYMDSENIGLKITSFDLDRNRNAKGKFLVSSKDVAQNILNEHGENCSTYKTAKNFLNDYSPLFAEYSLNDSLEYEYKILDLEEAFLENLLEDYSILLQNESEYLQSDEAIKETIEANNYEFTKDGEMY